MRGGHRGPVRLRLAAPSLLALVACAASCRSTLAELSDIAETPPLPYSVLVTGGAFVSIPRDPGSSPLARTYRVPRPAGEVLELDAVVDALLRARAFVRLDGDRRDARARLRVAELGQAFPVGDAALQAFLQAARRSGHDLLMVIEKIDDGPIEFRGINGQWPITAAAWLLIGLGMLIPDHTYESEASLRVALRDVQTGREIVPSIALNAGPVDLSLLARSDFLGLLEAIVIPPFWVGDDDEKVLAAVRGVSSERLLVRLARRLKSVDVRSRLEEVLPAVIEVERRDGAPYVSADAEESLTAVRLRVDAEPVEDPAFAEFERRFLESARYSEGRYRYGARCGLRLEGDTLQVLVRTVAGRVASATVSLAER